MADAYRARVDVSLPRVIAKVGKGDDAHYETQGVNYPAGSFILAENMTPRDQLRAEQGELDHILIPSSVEEAGQAGPSGEPEFGIFIAEHEAEAHALEQYGHHVVPKEQVMESLSAGADHAHDYQARVKELGLDRRPAQEAMAQGPPRIPEGLLVGAETRAGSPHHRGEQPEGYVPDGDDDGEEEGSESESEESQPRQRPGSEG